MLLKNDLITFQVYSKTQKMTATSYRDALSLGMIVNRLLGETVFINIDATNKDKTSSVNGIMSCIKNGEVTDIHSKRYLSQMETLNINGAL